jgi:ABC-2 type transport system permease protein
MSSATLAWRQFRFERRQFWRNPSAAFFNFLLPLVFLLLFASVFADDADQLNILIPGIAGMSVMATTFSALAFNVTFLREEGILKRVRGTPIPPGAYFAGFLGSAVVNAVVQVALVVTIGNLLYGVDWPRDWIALAFFTSAGVACFGALGIAMSHAIPNFDSAPAYVNAVFLPLIFISGVFYESRDLPVVLEDAAEVLPLKHVIDGLSGAIVTGEGIGGHWTAVAVIAAWTAFGLFAAIRWFRWE